MLYFLIFGIIVFCAWFFDANHHGTKRTRDISYFLLFLFLAFLSGLRYRIGTDSITYENWFTSGGLPTLGKFTYDDFSYNRWEPLFVLFGSTIKTLFGDNWVAFQLIHAIIVNYAFFWGFKKYSRYPFICAAIYFIWLYYPLNCEIMRQSLATAVWIFSLPYLFNKKYFNYFIVVAICFFIHRGSAILAILPFLGFLNNRKVLVSIVIVLLVIAKPLSDFVSNNILLLITLVGDADAGLTDTLINYSTSTGIEAFEFSLIGTLVFLFDGVVVYILIVSQVLKHNNTILGAASDFWAKYSYTISVFVILQMISLALPIFYRFSWLLAIFPVLYFAEYLGNKKRLSNFRNLIFLVSILFLFSLRLFFDYSRREDNTNLRFYQRFYPYSTVIDPVKYTDRENILYMYNK